MPATASALSSAAALCLLNSTIDSLSRNPRHTEEDYQARHAAALEALVVLAPRDADEAMLAAQVVAMHHASMDCYHKAAAPGLSDAASMRLLGHALALSRMSLRMRETLAKNKKGRRVQPQNISASVQAPAPQPMAGKPEAAPKPDAAPKPEAALKPQPAARPDAAAKPQPAARPERPPAGPAPAAPQRTAVTMPAAPSLPPANNPLRRAAKPGTARDALMASTAIPVACHAAA